MQSIGVSADTLPPGSSKFAQYEGWNGEWVKGTWNKWAMFHRPVYAAKAP